jgi:hypothetical protein
MLYPPNCIFVFGSNLRGIHGKGAALYAHVHYGAVIGVGEGPTGQAYALPTKTADFKRRSLYQIEESYMRFVEYAKDRPDWFLLTPFGTGLAGYSRKEIGVMVRGVGIPANVLLTRTWLVD